MLYVHRSERADYLADILADVLVSPLQDPMAPEVIAVPTRGVERWLSQHLSGRLGTSHGRDDGVAANISFPFPASLVGSAITAVTATSASVDPWAPERAAWAILEVLDEQLSNPALKPLHDHLRASSPRRRDGALVRFPTARRVADLFDHYSVHRPQMIVSWARGATAGLGRHSWQAELWQLVRARIGCESPAERLERSAALLAAEPLIVDLPPRLFMFGLTRLPDSFLQVLEALAAGRDVHLLLLHPSGALWESVEQVLPAPTEIPRRAADPSADVARNPLLRSWGRDAREMQIVLRTHGFDAGEYRPVDDEHRFVDHRVDHRTTATLLKHVQRAIHLDLPLPGTPADAEEQPIPVLDAADRSIQVHSCHGHYRQVEVMRDALLHLLEGDPTLEPRDVVIMCPDVETFAPLIEAVFAATPASAGGQEGIRVRLADRSLRQTNPLLATAAALLELVESRVTASQLIDFAGREPVRRRFRLDDEDLATIERWTMDMGTRWGLDEDHRSVWKLASLKANTWEFGFDRLLLGVTMSEEDHRLFQGTLPVDDVTGTSVELAGRFAELLSRLTTALRWMEGAKPAFEWVGQLIAATESLAEPAAGEGWQLDQLRHVLWDAVGGPEEPAGVQLIAPEVQSLLADRLRGQPTRANFRTGDLTVCTLVPMRSVPHRVVGLLGLDDGAFPRHPERDGDDLLLGDPLVGDREARSEDRQLLLDALLAAKDYLVITFNGRDERSNRERPPSVPVSELLDVVDRTVRSEDPGRRARDAVLVEHPLQSFDPRNFSAGALGTVGPWSFSRIDLGGAKALADPQTVPDGFLGERLPQLDGDVIALESLVGFAKHPVQWFLRQRLGLYMNGDVPDPEDSLPIELDPLDEWNLGDQLLRTRLSGATPEQAFSAELARGLLPPGPLANEVLVRVGSSVELILEKLGSFSCAQHQPRSMEVNVRLRDGRLLIGTVSGIRGSTVVTCIYSRLAPKHRLEAWVRLLALAASVPGGELGALTLGRSGNRRAGLGLGISELTMPPDRGDTGTALELIEVLVDLYDRGMREPLPIYCKTSAEWARAVGRSADDAYREAQRAWEGNRIEGESAEEAHRLVLGGILPFSQLITEPPRPDESGEGWPEEQRSRLGRLAVRLWKDLLRAEQMGYS